MECLALLGLGWLLVAVMMTSLWFVQRARRDAGVIDVGWAAGLGLLAILYALIGDGAPAYRVLLAVLAGLWSARLALYVYFNRVHDKDEDGRYQTLRARWGDQAQSRFLVFFHAQGVLAVLFSLPFVVVVNIDVRQLSIWAYVAIGLWVIAVAGETTADRQLAVFRADPANRGTTCRRGLWRYSRHPNYFFEWLHWWTYVLIAIGNRYWWATLVGPALMAFILLKVTGIPATEAQAIASRGDDYRGYQRTTSAFVPWPPKKQGFSRGGRWRVTIRHIERTAATELQGRDVAGVTKRVLISPADGWDGWVMRLFELRVGGHTPRHAHTWPHINYVVSGRGLLHLDGQEHPVGAGSYAFIPAGAEHQFANDGETVFSFICIVPAEGDV